MDEATREQPEAENAATELLPPVAVATERLASPERLPLVARPFSRGLTTLLLVGALSLTALAYTAELALAQLGWPVAPTLANQLVLGKVVVSLNRRIASGALVRLIGRHLILCIYL